MHACTRCQFSEPPIVYRQPSTPKRWPGSNIACPRLCRQHNCLVLYIIILLGAFTSQNNHANDYEARRIVPRTPDYSFAHLRVFNVLVVLTTHKASYAFAYNESKAKRKPSSFTSQSMYCRHLYCIRSLLRLHNYCETLFILFWSTAELSRVYVCLFFLDLF